MNLPLKAVIFFLFVFVANSFSPAAGIPGTTFPYLKIELHTPPQESATPGMGSYYSALPLGIETAMWNPSSLTTIDHAQTSLSYISQLKNATYGYEYDTDDGTYSFSNIDYINVNYYFTDKDNATAIATRSHTAEAWYQTQSTGIKFSQAFRFNDWLSWGVVSQNNVGGSMDLSGNFPVTGKTSANFLNKSDFFGTGISVDTSGYLTAIHTTEGGGTFQYTTTQPLWSGFTSQQSDLPITVISEARNDVSINPGYTLCGAFQWKNLSIGASTTPISANANINNSARAVVNEGTADIAFYQPDFNTDDTADLINWIYDPNLYASENGYTKNLIKVPAGEVVGEARYKGFYQASTLRNDLGFRYDFGENISLGLVFENFSGASLDFRGTGRVAYVNSRVSTAEPSGIDPTQQFTWDLFTDEFETVAGTEGLSLQELVNISLPKKTRIGLALKKPFLIALDYEQQQNPVVYTDNEHGRTITASNLRFIRIGGQTQLLFFPIIMNSGVNLLLKPDLAGLTASEEDGINNTFRFGAIPAAFDLGLGFRAWGTDLAADFGFNATSLLSIYQLDTLNQDIGKLLYYSIRAQKDPWAFKYIASVDPGSTASAWSNRTDKTEKLADITTVEKGWDWVQKYSRWIQTFSISYSF